MNIAQKNAVKENHVFLHTTPLMRNVESHFYIPNLTVSVSSLIRAWWTSRSLVWGQLISRVPWLAGEFSFKDLPAKSSGSNAIQILTAHLENISFLINIYKLIISESKDGISDHLHSFENEPCLISISQQNYKKATSLKFILVHQIRKIEN